MLLSKATLLLLPLTVALLYGCERNEVANAAEEETVVDVEVREPTFDGNDRGRERIEVRLRPVVTDVNQVTDIQFLPGDDNVMIVLQKTGEAYWITLSEQSRGEILQIDVTIASELGLLGLAFHPEFSSNRRFYTNHTVSSGGNNVSRVAEWEMSDDLRGSERRTLMELEQPYRNHNAGQLAFGPDGYLYVGWGDGGSGGDPLEHGQNPLTMHGSMLRIDVDNQDEGKEYAVPADNPFVDDESYLPETWAYGLRNPWRYSFTPDGRLVVADVGQTSWEEVNIVAAGRNYGWNIMEGRECFHPPEDCAREGLTYPLYAYEWGRDEGQSIIGGYVYHGDDIPALKGKYVFGDYVTERTWAIDLPEDTVEFKEPTLTPVALGRWEGLRITTFGQNSAGEMFVAGLEEGAIYRFVAP